MSRKHLITWHILLPFVYDDDKMERRDMEYMKSMYPNIPKKIRPTWKKNVIDQSMRTV